MRVAADEPTAPRPAPAPPAPAPAPAPLVVAAPASAQVVGDALFDDLVADVASAIASSVPPWRVRLGEAAARWQREGIATAVLERALRLEKEPDVDGLLAAFAQAVARLRALAREATALDPALAGHDAFRDPARMAEAQALVERAALPRPSARPPFRVDPEVWVACWPDVVGLLPDVD
jgi:hypothetical protein